VTSGRGLNFGRIRVPSDSLKVRREDRGRHALSADSRRRRRVRLSPRREPAVLEQSCHGGDRRPGQPEWLVCGRKANSELRLRSLHQRSDGPLPPAGSHRPAGLVRRRRSPDNTALATDFAACDASGANAGTVQHGCDGVLGNYVKEWADKYGAKQLLAAEGVEVFMAAYLARM